jgi:hypothetical protein
MTKKELIREIKDEANRRCLDDPQTPFVVDAQIAIEVIEGLDIE